MTTDPEAPDSGLDLERVRQTFEESTDFTIGLEEEFAIVNPETLELEHRFPELFEAAQARRGAGAGRARGADRQRDRDPVGAWRDLRRGRRAPARAPRRPLLPRGFEGAGAGRDGHPPVGRLPGPEDHRHPALSAAPKGPRLGRAAQQHLEPARPRRRARRRPGDRRLRLAARAAASPARGLGQLALPRSRGHGPAQRPHRDLHPDVPPLRGARAVPRLGDLRGLRRIPGRDARRWSRRRSSGGPSAPITPSAPSRSASATRRRSARSPSRSRA